MQEHLASAIPGQATTGIFDATTAANLAQFQTAHGIAAERQDRSGDVAGAAGPPAVAVNWTGERAERRLSLGRLRPSG